MSLHLSTRAALRVSMMTLAAASIGLFVTPARASLIGSDDFSYPNGNIDGQSGGTGWNNDFANQTQGGPASAWNNSTGSTVSNNQLSIVNGATFRDYSVLHYPHDTITGSGKVYFGFTQTVSTSNVLFAGLSAYDYGSEREFFGTPYQTTQTKYLGVYNIFGGTNNNTTHLSSVISTPGQTYNLVGEIDYDNRQINFWINAASEAVTPDVSFAFGDNNFNSGIRLAAGNSTGFTDPAVFDNVKVGTTFGDVVTVSPAVPEPASLGLLALGAIALTARRRKA